MVHKQYTLYNVDPQKGTVCLKRLVGFDFNESDSTNKQRTRDFQIGSGFGFVRAFTFNSNKKWFKLSQEICLKFTILDNYDDSKVFDEFISTELFFLNTVGIRFGGGTRDGGGTFGPLFKVSFLNHISLCLFPNEVYHPYMYMDENKPWVFGITGFNLLEWKRTDLRWWQVIEL